jgi:hypothetical protein
VHYCSSSYMQRRVVETPHVELDARMGKRLVIIYELL